MALLVSESLRMVGTVKHNAENKYKARTVDSVDVDVNINMKRIQDEKLNEKVDMCSLASCSKPGSKRCTRCRTVWYCSITCQTQDWKAGHD